MKQSEHNEIDSLLRHLAGSASSVHASGAKSIGEERGPHLDADELSSYAEGALPPAARSRYTSHLADCDDCRKMVVQLSLASGVVIKEEANNEGGAARVSWTQTLAAVLTPRVLRYAMPALVVMVLAVTFVVWRQQHDTSFIAMNQQAEGPAASAPQTKQAEEANQNGGGAGKGSATETRKVDRLSPSTSPTVVADEEAPKDDRGADKKAAGAPASSSSADEIESERKEKSLAKEQPREAKPVYAPDPAPAPPPAALRPVSNVAKAPAKTADEPVQARDKDKAAKQEEPDRSRGNVASTAQGPSAKRADERRKSGEAGATGGSGSEDQGETRSVSGRTFRKRNGAWVDSAYHSSPAATTSVARGSEQYRALVADEPGIAVIAGQLSGEVFLVWKGHAYHLH